MPASVEQVIERVSKEAFGRPLVMNVLRGHVVEAIVAMALEPEWTWCAGDYSSFDFEQADGLRLEVKQSAARQTWDPPSHGRIYPSFDIKVRTGRWEGAVFIEEPGRAAHIYLFAFNPRTDVDADHRDPTQWEFYVVPTGSLPATQRISLGAVRRLACANQFSDLSSSVGLISEGLKLTT
jgi:hypothetical protein